MFKMWFFYFYIKKERKLIIIERFYFVYFYEMNLGVLKKGMYNVYVFYGYLLLNIVLIDLKWSIYLIEIFKKLKMIENII